MEIQFSELPSSLRVLYLPSQIQKIIQGQINGRASYRIYLNEPAADLWKWNTANNEWEYEVIYL